MSPECSASAPPEMDMPENETETEADTSRICVLKNVQQLELNNNVSVPPIPMMSSSNSTTTVNPNQEKAKETIEQTCINHGQELEDEHAERLNPNLTFTKTYTNSFIEEILSEQKVGEPLAKFEETRIFHDKDISESSDTSESVASSKADDDVDDYEDNEDVEKKDAKKKLKRGRKIREEENIIKERLTRQVRSMSEGAAAVLHHHDGEVMVFPNLQDDALDALGLKRSESDEPKERLTEEEMEVKFQTLSLVFSIDAVTVGARVQLLRRQRDQADQNLCAEIERFRAAVHKLHPLCVDAETTELVTGLLDHLQFIVQASHRVLTCAEMYGSVQQEWRIADSVNLMLSHLRNVIKQRDAARRQLQITKRVLQETTSPTKPTVTMTTTRRRTINTIPSPTTVNGRATLPPRRASIAVISRPLDVLVAAAQAPQVQGRRTSVRRTSEAVSGERQEPSCRPWDYRRAPEWTQDRMRAPLLSRPSRLDINPELTKIQEGSTESFTSNNSNNSIDALDSSGSGDEFQTPTSTSTSDVLALEANPSAIYGYKRRVKGVLRHLGQMVMDQVARWGADGTLHEICFIGTTVCFLMATLLLWNTIIEIELARDGVHRVPWKYVTWEEFFSFFFTKK